MTSELTIEILGKRLEYCRLKLERLSRMKPMADPNTSDRMELRVRAQFAEQALRSMLEIGNDK